MGGISEAVAGLYLLFGFTAWDRFLGQLLATAMHIFIFNFGVGPYRWNVYHLFLGWVGWWLTSGLAIASVDGASSTVAVLPGIENTSIVAYGWDYVSDGLTTLMVMAMDNKGLSDVLNNLPVLLPALVA